MGKPPSTPWGLRASAAGLDRSTLALLAGMAPKNVTQGLKGERVGGVPVSLLSIILVWEMLSEDQRLAWVAAVKTLREGEGSPPRNPFFG